MTMEVESGAPSVPPADPDTTASAPSASPHAAGGAEGREDATAASPSEPSGAEPAAPPSAVIEPQSWDEMGLRAEVKRALEAMGFELPMPVQRAVYPRMMAGADIEVQSRTGSGKTAAFGIPFAQGLIDPERMQTQALVLAPTRELALQVAHECEKIAAYRGLRVAPIYGGAPMGKQIEALKEGAHVVAGTPGRVLDHLRRGTLKLDALRVLVLDEADEMLSMGFYEDITDIIKRCPAERQTLLFSATFPEDIERIAQRYMRSPEKLHLSADFVGVHEIQHAYYMVSGMGRTRDLVRVLGVEKPDSAIIFCNTREDTALVADYLRNHGFDAEAISSDLGQKDRERVMGRMKEKNLQYLVATDIAARGIDISNLSHVINYTFPESAEVYVHRTGRTGRAGKTGTAISLIAPRELGNFYMLKLTYKIRPEERTLPSEAEWRTEREAARLEELRAKLGTREASEEWRQIARRLWSAEDGERLVALLLEERLKAPAVVSAVAGASEEAPRRERVRLDRRVERERGERGERSGRSRDRERLATHDLPDAVLRAREPISSEAPRPVPATPSSAAPVDGFPGDAGGAGTGSVTGSAGVAGDEADVAATAADGTGEAGGEAREGEPRKKRRRRRPEGGRDRARPEPRRADTIDTSDGREFWEAWVDSRSEEPNGTPANGERKAGERNGNGERGGEGRGNGERSGNGERNGNGEGRREPALAPGQVRLYLNLGRRDGAREPEVERLLGERDITVDAFQVHNSHTYLVVADERADAVIAACNGGKWNDRDLVCERARK